jgi:hypothetical protein
MRPKAGQPGQGRFMAQPFVEAFLKVNGAKKY